MFIYAEGDDAVDRPSNSRTCFQRIAQVTPTIHSGYDPSVNPQPLEPSSLAQNLSAVNESLQLERSTRANTVYQAQISNGLMMKFLCCFQTVERDEQYRIADGSPQPQKYSWYDTHYAEGHHMNLGMWSDPIPAITRLRTRKARHWLSGPVKSGVNSLSSKTAM